MIGIGPVPAGGTTAGPATRGRLTERHVLALGLAVSAAFIVAASAAAVAMVTAGGSPWAPIHLALAGAATVAIGTFMPHFAVTLAGTRPEAPAQRLAALALLATGAGLAVVGVTLVGGSWAALGAAVSLGGLALVTWETLVPLRDPLARRHHVVTVAYAVALLELAGGIAIGGMGAAGIDTVTQAWATLRASHAWLTLFGAVSLTIFATLVYLAPTVNGARIRAGAALAIGTAGMLVGPIMVAAGFGLGFRPVVVGGLALTLAGALGQVGYALDAYRRRGRFTTEHNWRRVAVGHLSAGPGWFAAAAVVATFEIGLGRPLAGWLIGTLAVPMIAGWMLQELVGSWTHLLPSVTPGSPATHASQRRILAIASLPRLIAWNVGVALAWIGLAFDLVVLAVPGAGLLTASMGLSVLLLARALLARGASG